MVSHKYTEHEKQVSAMGCLYDPYWGDRMYSESQWEKAFDLSDFNVQVVKTPYCSFKDKRDSHRLRNFILTKKK